MEIITLVLLITFYWAGHHKDGSDDTKNIGPQLLLVILLVLCAFNFGFSVFGILAKNRRDYIKNQIFKLYLILLIIFFGVYLIIMIVKQQSNIVTYYSICNLVICPLTLLNCQKLSNLLKGIKFFFIYLGFM